MVIRDHEGFVWVAMTVRLIANLPPEDSQAIALPEGHTFAWANAL